MAWLELDRAEMPNGDVLTLRRRGGDYEIRVNLFELMSSKNPVSERAMAEAACARVNREAARVLIGGLGMGYTLRAVLDDVGAAASVTVAELVPAVVGWNRGLLAGLAGHPLDDPRVSVFAGDVAEAIAQNPGGFDAILMDVDNGPEAVLFDGNEGLYDAAGVRFLLSGLAANGVLGVWSANCSDPFEQALQTSGLAVDRLEVAVTPTVRHAIYLVQRP